MQETLFLNEDVAASCSQLSYQYPFVTAHVIGHSVMGKPLLALRCGEGEQKIHINAAFHGNEWITSALLMRFMNELSATYGGIDVWGLEDHQVAYLREEVTVWAVPMVNPDGAELVQCGIHESHPMYHQLVHNNGGSADFSNWKSNIRGVDLNDQFPAYWDEECARRGVFEPAASDYPGPYPLSEPEAAAMAQFTETLRFKQVAALHTQGEEIYWNYRNYEPPEAQHIAARLKRVSGYKAIKLTGSDAGYKDWFIKQYRKPGFTIEAGYGRTPLPFEHFEQIYAKIQPLLLEYILL
ncbi:M14 family metallocarboxypeptidase [Paenibacillus yanchengensis]|uniref:M14 family metallocarboxypeptidase n=1 Tax=Paenibacillus yanchengensis TaxID=2035833 RepID=A0ABW4YP57_9BACL